MAYDWGMIAPFIKTIRLDNILSYGPSGTEFPLGPLNVLIGPNTSGKSNLIEVLSLLAAAPRDLQRAIWQGGGVRDWIWKGEPAPSAATVEITMAYKSGMPMRYRLSFTEVGARFTLRDEALENEKPSEGNEEPYFYYRYQDGDPALNVVAPEGETRTRRRLAREDVKPGQSILSQRRDPDAYPELTYVAERLERTAFYREWNFGRATQARNSQKTDLPQDSLREDASNLAPVLSRLLNKPQVKQDMLERMRDFHPTVTDIQAPLLDNTVQVSLHEERLRDPVPATRLSDGTLKYLCLLAALCNPEPPPLICIEEPEIGLHPDIIPKVAELLVEASSRSQLVVTTHSPVLVDALTDSPESVVVCEKVNGATELRRVRGDKLAQWLKGYGERDYHLGELWTRGDLGGNRW